MTPRQVSKTYPKTKKAAKSLPAQPINTPERRWAGALQGLHGPMLHGWCLDTQQPDHRVVLEVCLNGEPIGSLIADVARTDLMKLFARSLPGQPPSDACHGFVADLGANADQHSGTYTVRVANTTTQLDGHFDQTKTLSLPASAISNVFSDGALRLHGWAKDPADDKRVMNIRAYAGNELVGETTANLLHPALNSYAVGKHGFQLDLPLTLADGQIHSVRVVDGAGMPLNGSPITVCTYAAGSKALLPDLAGEQGQLLTHVMDTLERYVPRSLGLQHYAQWAEQFETPTSTPPAASTLRVGLIVTGNANPQALQRTLDSLKHQTHPETQIFAAQDKAQKPRSFAKLLRLALQSPCDVIGCVRAGDTLAPHALACALEGFALPQASVVYTDSEHLGQPWFKPAWNPEYALCSDYPLELMLSRTSSIQSMASEATLPDTPQALSWQLLSHLGSQGDTAIVHIPRVLYTFHSVPDATEQQARTEAAQQALQTTEPQATLKPMAGAPAHTLFQPRQLQRPLSPADQSQVVSLIIPTRDRVELLERCITTLKQFTAWRNLEIIVVDNDSVQAKSKTYLRSIAKQGVKVIQVPGAFNFATLNNLAIEAASGDIIGLINNDIEALHAGWLDEIVSHLMRPGVGAVGAKLLWPNGMVQHGGVLLGVGNVAGHYGNRLADADWGDHGRNQLTQQVSGVTAACLFMHKRDYLAVGGMDGRTFPVAFNDVDLCLKLRQLGKTILWTPHARLLHAESASRGHEDTPQKLARAQREVEHLRQRWGSVLLNDPAYHPSLNLDPHSHAFGGLALPPRPRRPRLAGLFGTAPLQP